MIPAELMRPLPPATPASHSLREAADQIADSDEAFTVVVHHHEVVGVLTADDVLSAARADPTGWQGQLCASMITLPLTHVSARAPMAEVLREYREDGVRPLVVFDGQTPVGVLRPAEVRAWGQEHGYLPYEDVAPGITLGKSEGSEVPAP